MYEKRIKADKADRSHMNRKILYLMIEQNVGVQHPKVHLGDIAELICSDKRMENELMNLRILTIENDNKGRFPMQILHVIDVIQTIYPQLRIYNLGESDFIITYEKEKHKHRILSVLKTIVVCILTFFGSAFSIMTFNNDVDLPKLFSSIYYQVTGKVSDGYTILEFSYSLGLAIGVLLFFNHFGRKKFTQDPSPLEVEMRSYEDNVNQTFIKKGGKDAS